MNPSATPLERLAMAPKPLALGFFVLALVSAVLTVVLAYRWDDRRKNPPTDAPTITVSADKSRPVADDANDGLFAAVALGMAALGFSTASGTTLLRTTTGPDAVSGLRVTLLLAVGMIGLLSAWLGAIYLYRWQESVLAWVTLGNRTEARFVMFGLGLLFGGLVVMFAALGFVRSQVRINPVLRRLAYGYNAVLTTLLVLVGLTAVNVLAFVKLPNAMATTAAAFTGLSEPSKEFLRTIDQPVKAYLVMNENQRIDEIDYAGVYTDCRSLLKNCEAENPKIQVSYLSPSLDDAQIKRLIPEEHLKKFGIYLVVGEGQSAYLDYHEMLELSQAKGLVFQGEQRLMTELNFLVGGGSRPTIGFTQSNDELPLTGAANGERGLRTLAEYLRQRKCDVEAVRFEPEKPVDLAKYTILVIAAPQVPFAPEQLDALRGYRRAGGKLIVLVPALPGRNSPKVQPTGLEPLLVEMGVRIEPATRAYGLVRQGNALVLTPVLEAMLATGRSGGRDALSEVLNQPYLLDDARPLLLDPPPMLSVEPLLTSLPNRDTIVSTLAEANAVAAERPARTRTAHILAATVADRTGKPQAVIVGTDSFVDDLFLGSPQISRTPYLSGFSAMVNWLRERPAGVKVEPRALGLYTLKKDATTTGLLWLPLGLTLLGITALGTGVWIVRRR